MAIHSQKVDQCIHDSPQVYDLSMGMARAMSPMLLGRTIDLIPHTGVVCEGEWEFEAIYVQIIQHCARPSSGDLRSC